jgi:colicin import membrane protein
MSEVIESKIETGLQTLDEKEASLIELRDKYAGLKITGLTDKDGYLKVREGRLACKNQRVQIEKAGKALRDNAIKFQKAVIKRENELIAIIESTELSLKQEEETFNELREQQRLEEEKKKREFVQGRIDALAKFGHGIDVYTAEIMEEENFQALLGHAEAEWQKEQQRLAELKAEEERKRKEEEEFLRAEREELARQKAEQAKRESEFKAEQDRIRKEQEEKESAIRAEQERKVAELEAERQKLEAERMAIELERTKRDAAERARLEEQQRIEREAKEKEQRELQEKIRAERAEALKPDKEKLIAFSDRIAALCLERPGLKDDASNDIASNAIDHLSKVISYIHENVQGL